MAAVVTLCSVAVSAKISFGIEGTIRSVAVDIECLNQERFDMFPVRLVVGGDTFYTYGKRGTCIASGSC
jgi:hypothetical protein